MSGIRLSKAAREYMDVIAIMDTTGEDPEAGTAAYEELAAAITEAEATTAAERLMVQAMAEQAIRPPMGFDPEDFGRFCGMVGEAVKAAGVDSVTASAVVSMLAAGYIQHHVTGPALFSAAFGVK